MNDEEDINRQVAKEVTSRLLEYAKSNGMSMSKIAEALAIPRSTLSRLRNDRATLSLPTLMKICKYIGIDLSSVFRKLEQKALSPEESHDDSPLAGPISVYFDSGIYAPEEQSELLSLLSELYSLQSGDRLVIESMGTAQPALTEALNPNGGW